MVGVQPHNILWPPSMMKLVSFTRSLSTRPHHYLCNELDEYLKLRREDYNTCQPLSGRKVSTVPQLVAFSIPGKFHNIFLHLTNIFLYRFCCRRVCDCDTISIQCTSLNPEAIPNTYGYQESTSPFTYRYQISTNS